MRYLTAKRAVLWMLPLLMLGCGKGYDLAPVKGRITRDGQPVADLHVTFQPVAAADVATVGPASIGTTDGDGNYELRCVAGDASGAVTGEHVVTIVHASSAFFTSDDDAAAPPPPPFKIPRKFSDGSTHIEVPASGTLSADFVLDGLP